MRPIRMRLILSTLFAITIFSALVHAEGLLIEPEYHFDVWDDWGGDDVYAVNWTISTMTAEGFASWTPPDGPPYPINNLYVRINDPSYRKESLALVVSTDTGDNINNPAKIHVKINGNYLGLFTLDGGEYEESGWKKEILISSDLGDYANADGNDIIRIVAIGGAKVTISKFLYGDYPFCTVKGEVQVADGDPWGLKNADFSLLYGAGNESFRDGVFYNGVKHSDEEGEAIQFEYSITGLHAALGTYSFTADIFGHSCTEAHQLNFTPGETKTGVNFSVNVDDSCKQLEQIRRPSASIPIIVSKESTPVEFFIELDAPQLMTGSFAAELSNGYITRSLNIADASYGQYIYNNSTNGWRLTVQLLNPHLLPEDLYDLTVTWQTASLPRADFSSRSVQLINGYYDDYFSNDDYYFIHVSDTHTVSSEDFMESLERVVPEWNLINPAFIIITGDMVEGSIGWAVNHMALLEFTRNLRIPILCCPGNHDYQGGSEALDAVVRAGYDKFHGQNLYAFTYDDDYYFCGDDNYTGEDAGYSGTEPGFLHIDDVAWLSDHLDTLVGYPTFICTFSHQYNRCPEPPPPASGWSLVRNFGKESNIVDLHLSGHYHSAHYDPPYITTEFTGARVTNYSWGTGKYGIHYIKNNYPHKPEYVSNWTNSALPRTGDFQLTFQTLGPAVQEATINNDSEWLIPKAKARFVFKGVTGSETWTITGTSGTSFAEIEQVFYSDSGTTAVVDVIVEIAKGPGTIVYVTVSGK